MLPNWKFANNSQPNSIDRIWVGWNPDKVNLTICKCSTQLIYTIVTSVDNALTFEASFVYGSNNIQDRKSLWTELTYISASIGNTPWITLGDFNVVLSPFEVFGGSSGRDDGDVDFTNLIYSICLEDLKYTSFYFT